MTDDPNLKLIIALQRMLDREIPLWRLDQRSRARRIRERCLRRLARERDVLGPRRRRR
jgi:hypothetical protein